jgi:hypothetical protein
MLSDLYKLLKNAMSLQSNISISQLVLSCIGTVVTILVITVGAYINLKVAGAERETRLTALEKRIDKTDDKFDKIMDKLTELEVKIGNKQ